MPESSEDLPVTPRSFPQSFNLVFFGGSGDLVTRKLLPALYQCHKHGQLVDHGRIICLGLEPYT